MKCYGDRVTSPMGRGWGRLYPAQFPDWQKAESLGIDLSDPWFHQDPAPSRPGVEVNRSGVCSRTIRAVRYAALLIYMQGLSLAQVAEVLNTSPVRLEKALLAWLGVMAGTGGVYWEHDGRPRLRATEEPWRLAMAMIEKHSKILQHMPVDTHRLVIVNARPIRWSAVETVGDYLDGFGLTWELPTGKKTRWGLYKIHQSSIDNMERLTVGVRLS